MTKTATRTRTSKAVKKKSDGKFSKSAQDATGAGLPPDINNRDHLLTMTEDEGMQVHEARCMAQLLEDMAIFGPHEITISRGSFLVAMSFIREKLTFKARLMSVDAAAGSLQDHGHM